ncbi:MAG TPA: GNAT family N-acetyltransferase [Candidatus Binataceae bacterium]
MSHQPIKYHRRRELPLKQIIALYRANGWSAADKPQRLKRGLRNSHAVVSAWDGQRLVGLGNAISDGSLVVYYPHLLVHPDYHGRGIGRRILMLLLAKYAKFHQQMLVAEPQAARFYRKFGFKPAGRAQALEIFQGHEHQPKTKAARRCE